jgi:uncharacterized protein Yka (UPF0111/DUF47 family)
MDTVNGVTDVLGLIQGLANVGGVGLVLYVAIQLFKWKRADDKSYQETLLKLAQDVTRAMEQNTQAIETLRGAVTEQQETVDRLTRIEQKLDGLKPDIISREGG